MAAIKLNEPAKPFSLVGVDEHKHALADYGNKEAVVIFSCNHCPYVKAWEDRMVQIQTDYDPKGAQLLVINANDAKAFPADSFPKMQERPRRRGLISRISTMRPRRLPGSTGQSELRKSSTSMGSYGITGPLTTTTIILAL